MRDAPASFAVFRMFTPSGVELADLLLGRVAADVAAAAAFAGGSGSETVVAARLTAKIAVVVAVGAPSSR